MGASDLVECLCKVFEDVVDVFRTNGETDCGRSDVLFSKLLRRKLRVSSGVRMNHQTLHVGNIGKEGEDLERIDEFPSCFLSALDFEGEDAACTLREILLVKFVVGMLRQRRMIHFCHFWMVLQEIHYFQCILHMTLHTQTQCFQTLQENEGIEWRKCSTCITKDDGTNTSDKCCSASHICKNRSMIGWFRLGKCRILVGIGFPIKLATIYDDATKR